MAASGRFPAADIRIRLDENGEWYGEDATGNRVEVPIGKLSAPAWPEGHFRLEQLSHLYRIPAQRILEKHGLSLDGCGSMTVAELVELEKGEKFARNKQKKHLLTDDENTICLAAARDTGSNFQTAAAFVRDFRKKWPKCKATQKALEQMLSRECDIWKKRR